MPSRQHLDLAAIARRAMMQYGLQPDFTPAALAQASALDGAPLERTPAIRDLRDRLWCSIDNDDSRDLDQLSVAESPASGTHTSAGTREKPGTRVGVGGAKIFVAIADVDAAVPEGSAIDDHARTNTTSVYTAAGIFPMLPERLSTDITSLNEGEERLAIVIEMTIAEDGTVAAADVYRGLVFNHAKLAYDSVAAWLDERGPAPEPLAAVPGLDDQIRLQDRLAQAMNARRHQRGALDLETRQARPVFEGDALADLRPDEDNRAKAMIEDFMIAANSVTATYLEAKGFPSLRRVLRAPKRWDRIVELAAQLDARLPANPDAVALQQFLLQRRRDDPDRFADLSLSVVKLLGSGEYAIERPGEQIEGHFGLAAKDYTHSTAPNRRFPDLVTQRLLKTAIAGRPAPTDYDDLAALAQHCTAQEDNAAKVERQVQKSAAALLLVSRIGQRFNAIVTGASEKGTWVRISRPSVEGKVVRGAAGLDVGDRVEVELLNADVGRGFIDFARV